MKDFNNQTIAKTNDDKNINLIRSNTSSQQFFGNKKPATERVFYLTQNIMQIFSLGYSYGW